MGRFSGGFGTARRSIGGIFLGVIWGGMSAGSRFSAGRRRADGGAVIGRAGGGRADDVGGNTGKGGGGVRGRVGGGGFCGMGGGLIGVCAAVGIGGCCFGATGGIIGERDLGVTDGAGGIMGGGRGGAGRGGGI